MLTDQPHAAELIALVLEAQAAIDALNASRRRCDCPPSEWRYKRHNCQQCSSGFLPVAE